MSANAHALWFTQMIEYEVPSVCQHALAQAWWRVAKCWPRVAKACRV